MSGPSPTAGTRGITRRLAHGRARGTASLTTRRDEGERGRRRARRHTVSAPRSVHAQDIPTIDRNRTLILRWGGREGRHIDAELWNPYAVGANHQNGSASSTSRWPSTAPSPTRRSSGWPRATSTAPTSRADDQDPLRDHLERRQAVQRRGRGLHVQRAARPRARRSRWGVDVAAVRRTRRRRPTPTRSSSSSRCRRRASSTS